ncbi:5996_t:CDS:2, partial [Paraglomus occultum]
MTFTRLVALLKLESSSQQSPNKNLLGIGKKKGITLISTIMIIAI